MIIICREDLPFNPDAIKKKYPHSRCWEIEEFFVKAKEDPELYKEARRVFWECLPGDVVVPCRIDGYFTAMPISSIVNLFKTGVRIDVLTLDDNLKLKFVKVIDVREMFYEGDAIEIYTTYGKSTIVTPNHVIPTTLGLIFAADFTKLQYEILLRHEIFTDNQSRIPESSNNKDLITHDEARLLGYILAEGCYHRKGTKRTDKGRHYIDCISLTNKSSELIEDCCSILDKIDAYYYLRYRKDRDRLVLRATVPKYKLKGLRNLFSKLGVERISKSYEKTIPFKLFFCSKELLRQFLRGLYSGDGCIKGKECLDYATSSFLMAQQVYWMLKYLGFNPKIRYTEGNQRTLYRLHIDLREEIEKFYDEIGFIQTDKMERLSKLLETGALGKRERMYESPTLALQKVRIKYYRGAVYDLKVEYPHTFFAGFGILVHNSYWRRIGYYRGRHRFFDAYEDGKRLTRDEDKMRVLGEIIISAWEHGIVPREVIRMRRIKGWPPAYRRLPRKKPVLV